LGKERRSTGRGGLEGENLGDVKANGSPGKNARKKKCLVRPLAERVGPDKSQREGRRRGAYE